MKYSSRFFLYAPLAMFLAIAAWAMSHWWIVATDLDKKLTALNGHEAIPGVSISYSSKTISGFPFNIDVVFTDFAIRGAGPHGPFAWQSDRFALHRLTYGRAQDIYEAAGSQALSWTDAAGTAHHIVFLPGSLRASAITDARGLSRFDLDTVAAGGTDSAGKRFTVTRAQFHLRRNPRANALDLMLSADDARTDTPVHLLRDYLSLSDGAALAPLLAGEMSWTDADAAWRKAGGAVIPGQRQVAPAASGAAADAIASSLY